MTKTKVDQLMSLIKLWRPVFYEKPVTDKDEVEMREDLEKAFKDQKNRMRQRIESAIELWFSTHDKKNKAFQTKDFIKFIFNTHEKSNQK